jgi:glycosyltransferase involved in cell wall biosynthesis
VRVLCIIDKLNSGGAQRQLIAVAAGVKRRGAEVSVLTWHPDDFYLPYLQAADIPHKCVARSGKMDLQRALAAEIKASKCDVVLAFQDNAALVAELASFPSRRWGLVVSERIALPTRQRFPWKRMLHLRSDYVTTNSHTNRILIERDVPALRGRMVTIYNGLDLEMFSPAKEPIARDKSRLHLVTAARYARQKNTEGLISAIDIARKSSSYDIQADWYGDPKSGDWPTGSYYFDKAHEQIAGLGLKDVVRANGECRKIIEEYRRADAVILPSHFEGLPNVVCEAMACGRPILMSRTCDAGNLVTEGVNGFLFDPTDPADMARTLLKLADMDVAAREEMGRQSRVMAERMFDVENFVDRYYELLQAAVTRKRTPVSHWVPTVPDTAYTALK